VGLGAVLSLGAIFRTIVVTCIVDNVVWWDLSHAGTFGKDLHQEYVAVTRTMCLFRGRARRTMGLVLSLSYSSEKLVCRGHTSSNLEGSNGISSSRLVCRVRIRRPEWDLELKIGLSSANSQARMASRANLEAFSRSNFEGASISSSRSHNRGYNRGAILKFELKIRLSSANSQAKMASRPHGGIIEREFVGQKCISRGEIEGLQVRAHSVIFELQLS